MKAMCFLTSTEHKRYSFLCRKLRDGEKVARDEFSVTIKPALDILVHIEFGIRGNQKYTHYNHCGRQGHQQKGCIGHFFLRNRREAPNKV